MDPSQSHAQLISEPITPDRASFDAAAMARGELGVPSGFAWRERHFVVTGLISHWKQSEAENHAPGGERYYRKHCFRLTVDTGEIMTIYGVRRVKRGESPHRRWWLYSIETPGASTARELGEKRESSQQ